MLMTSKRWRNRSTRLSSRQDYLKDYQFQGFTKGLARLRKHIKTLLLHPSSHADTQLEVLILTDGMRFGKTI